MHLSLNFCCKKVKKILPFDFKKELLTESKPRFFFMKPFLVPFLQQAKNIYVNISYLGFNLWH